MKKTVVLVYIAGESGEIHPAIYYLKEFVRNRRKDLNFVTLTFPPGKPIPVMASRILRYKPVFTGLSTYIWNRDQTLQLVRTLKRRYPEIPVILGGAEASYNARRILNSEPSLDLIARDEAEETFAELTDFFCGGKGDLSAIRGIVYHKGKGIEETSPRPALDLKKVRSPFLAAGVPLSRTKNVTYETTRGCPYKCAYCSYNAGSYAFMRFFALSRVLRELSFILGKSPRRVNVVDDNFNINELRAIKIVKSIRQRIKSATILTLFLRADVWKLGRGLAKLLSHRNIFCTIGVQSLNPATLKGARRIHNRENLESNLRLLNEYQVKYILQFIVGLPGDRYDDVKAMIDWAFSYRPYDIHLQTLRINPFTVYEKEADAFGILYRRKPPYTVTQTVSMLPGELKRAEKLAACFQAFYKRKSLRKKLIRLHEETRLPVSQIVEGMLRKKRLRL